ncbi:hypothetical protein P691DRAFT_670891, partial [Macrolepiota fuliginosa MF-IS2]
MCLYSLYLRPNKPEKPSSSQSRHRSRVKIDQINDRVRQLDATIAELSRQRAVLLQELNAVQPPTAILPAEILSYIFQFACRSPEFSHWYYMRSVLHNVSTYWRQILVSTPQLWTGIHLNIGRESTKSEATLLSHFLKRSGNLPLTLSFDYDYDINADPGDTLVHQTVDAQLLENLHR